MRRLLMGLLVLGLGVPIAPADDTPSTKPDPAAVALNSLNNEFVAAQKIFGEKVQAAKDAAQKNGTQPKSISFDDSPGPIFSPRYLALAEKNPEGPTGFQAIVMTLNTSGGPGTKVGTWPKAIALLSNHFATKPEIQPLLKSLALTNDDDAENLVREVIARNPDRKIQAQACQALASGNESIAGMIDQLKQNEVMRKNFEALRGKDYVAKLMAHADQRKTAADELKKVLHEKYADLVVDLTIGKPAPEVVMHDLDGKEAKLSALKGKVVVLDFWATWCPPCRAMIPHEREMVERLKDKPFALISISADEKKETLKQFLAQEKMPWAHWWNGSQGGVIEAWNIEQFPTIYVIDAEGVIRHKDLRGQKLEDAVNELLRNVEQKKAG